MSRNGLFLAQNNSIKKLWSQLWLRLSLTAILKDAKCFSGFYAAKFDTEPLELQRKTCVSCFSKQGICTADSPWTEHSSIHSLGDIRPLRPL